MKSKLKNSYAKKSWRHGSNGGAPAYQAEGPVFNPNTAKKNKKKKLKKKVV
jgi:hypothetical protein